jgi:hypothetical protein
MFNVKMQGAEFMSIIIDHFHTDLNYCLKLTFSPNYLGLSFVPFLTFRQHYHCGKILVEYISLLSMIVVRILSHKSDPCDSSTIFDSLYNDSIDPEILRFFDKFIPDTRASGM